MKNDSITYKRPDLDVEYDFVAVVDTLPRSDRGDFGLTDEILSILNAESICWKRFDCGNAAAVAEAFRTLAEHARKGKRFCLHCVGHGNDDALGVGEDDSVSWREFGGHLMPINDAMLGDLIVNMTCCRGVHGIKSVPLASEKDPFFGIVGPREDLDVQDALDINRRLYRKWFAGTPINTIVHEINRERGRQILFCASAEGYRILTGRNDSSARSFNGES